MPSFFAPWRMNSEFVPAPADFSGDDTGPLGPEIIAFDELRQLVRHLADELASFRRRALTAEARLREIEGLATDEHRIAPSHIMELEHENGDLKERVDAAAHRTRQLLEQLRFLRQQAVDEEAR